MVSAGGPRYNCRVLSREQILIGIAAMVVAGLVGGAVVGLAVRGDDNARAKLPEVPKSALISPDRRDRLSTATPQNALLELWSSAQWGDIPRTLRLQDPIVRRATGDSVVGGVYDHQRSRMTTRRPRITSTEVRGRIATVRYWLQGEPRTPPPQLAILRRRGGVWFMRYDTFVEDAIPYYITSVRGGDVNPQRGDRVAGAKAAAAYRKQAAKLALLPAAEAPETPNG